MAPLPDLTDVRTLPVYDERVVPEDYIDENGHMNIGHYFRLTSHAVWHRVSELGMGADYIERRGMSFFTVEHRIAYLAELRLGQRFSVRAGVVDRAARAMHGAAYVVDEEGDRIACALEAIYVHIEMADRRAAPIPDDLAAALDREIEERSGWLPAVATGLALRR